MNDFDWSFTIGRFFITWIINDLFCGIGIRIGKDVILDSYNVYHVTIQIGYGMLSIGIK